MALDTLNQPALLSHVHNYGEDSRSATAEAKGRSANSDSNSNKKFNNHNTPQRV